MDVVTERRLDFVNSPRERNPRQLLQPVARGRHQECIDHVIETMVKHEVLVRRLVEELLRHRLKAWLSFHLAVNAGDVVLGVVDAESTATVVVGGKRHGIGDQCGYGVALNVIVAPATLPLRGFDNAQQGIALALNPFALEREAQLAELRAQGVAECSLAGFLPQMEEARGTQGADFVSLGRTLAIQQVTP